MIHEGFYIWGQVIAPPGNVLIRPREEEFGAVDLGSTVRIDVHHF
jgi:hypothetical protein